MDCELVMQRLLTWWNGRNESRWEIQEVRMTGGEPLMDLSSVLKLARACRRYQIRSGINTNASLLTGDSAKLLKDAGLTVVKISFDTCDEGMFRRMRGACASLIDTMNGIRIAVDQDFHVILRFTLCKYNVDELIECYRLAREMGVRMFQIKPLIRAGRAALSDAFLNPREVADALGKLAFVVSGTVSEPEILCWPPDKAGRLHCKVCGSIDKIYIATNGDIFSCNYISTDAPISNLTQDSFDSIFNKRSPLKWRSPSGHVILDGCAQVACFQPEGGEHVICR
jgi:MoaA/NifB/PqqE/SkfB family radical SAM enzyme